MQFDTAGEMTVLFGLFDGAHGITEADLGCKVEGDGGAGELVESGNGKGGAALFYLRQRG